VDKMHTDENHADMLTSHYLIPRSRQITNTKIKHCLDLVGVRGAQHPSGVW
jgi:hypothetical protein